MPIYFILYISNIIYTVSPLAAPALSHDDIGWLIQLLFATSTLIDIEQSTHTIRQGSRMRLGVTAKVGRIWKWPFLSIELGCSRSAETSKLPPDTWKLLTIVMRTGESIWNNHLHKKVTFFNKDSKTPRNWCTPAPSTLAIFVFCLNGDDECDYPDKLCIIFQINSSKY